MRFEHIRKSCQYIAVELVDLQIAWRLVIRQPVIAFKIVRASSVGIVPAKFLVHVIVREGSSGPVVAVGAGFGIYEEAVKQAEALRQGMMIGRHRLRRPVRPLRGCTVAENGEGGLTIRGGSVAVCFPVATDRVVCAVFL